MRDLALILLLDLASLASAAAAEPTSRETPDPVPVASPGLRQPGTGAWAVADPPFGFREGSGDSCGGKHDASAYVCCDGEGGFAVCRGRSSGSRLLLGCIDRHEQDHLNWFAEHHPGACLARPRGACRFELTPRQYRELECSGYRAEFRCLAESRAYTTGRRRAIGDLLWRQRQLREDAERRFACSTDGW